MISIQKAEPNISEADIDAFEVGLGVKLPLQYRRFLISNNGGSPTPDTIDIDGLSGSPTDLQTFFGINRGIKTSNLSWRRDTYADRIPNALLPIACDSGGSLFCLAISGADIGKIFFHAYESGPLDFHFVAQDFDALLEKIRS
jgi:hypothetical protein